MQISLVAILTIVLVVLKVTGKIAISWLWAFSPMWIPLVGAIILIGIVAFIAWIGNR